MDEELEHAFRNTRQGFMLLQAVVEQRIRNFDPTIYIDQEHLGRLNYTKEILKVINALLAQDAQKSLAVFVDLTMTEISELTQFADGFVRKFPDTLEGFDQIESSFEQLTTGHFCNIGTLHERTGNKDLYVPPQPYYNLLVFAYDLFFHIETGSYKSLRVKIKKLLDQVKIVAQNEAHSGDADTKL